MKNLITTFLLTMVLVFSTFAGETPSGNRGETPSGNLSSEVIVNDHCNQKDSCKISQNPKPGNNIFEDVFSYLTSLLGSI